MQARMKWPSAVDKRWESFEQYVDKILETTICRDVERKIQKSTSRVHQGSLARKDLATLNEWANILIHRGSADGKVK